MRKKLKEDSESPIDILALINNLKNSTLVFYPMSDRISGMCIKEGQSNIIGINSNMSYGRQRFTVAHELYHLFYEEELKTVICQKDIYGQKPDSEKEADTFASYLLAPYDSLRSYIKENKLLENKEHILKDIID